MLLAQVSNFFDVLANSEALVRPARLLADLGSDVVVALVPSSWIACNLASTDTVRSPCDIGPDREADLFDAGAFGGGITLVSETRLTGSAI